MVCARGAKAAAVPRIEAFILGDVCSALLVRLTHGQYSELHSGISLPAKTASIEADGRDVTTLGVAVGKANIPAFHSIQGRYYPPRVLAV